MENGNESAFPVVNGVTGVIAEKGLTKREYFAAMAMQGVIASYTNAFPNAETIAKKSIELTDALLSHLSNIKANKMRRTELTAAWIILNEMLNSEPNDEWSVATKMPNEQNAGNKTDNPKSKTNE